MLALGWHFPLLLSILLGSLVHEMASPPTQSGFSPELIFSGNALTDTPTGLPYQAPRFF